MAARKMIAATSAMIACAFGIRLNNKTFVGPGLQDALRMRDDAVVQAYLMSVNDGTIRNQVWHWLIQFPGGIEWPGVVCTFANVVKALKVEDEIDWNAALPDGNTALHFAAMHRDTTAFATILRVAAPFVNVNIQNRAGDTALHWAAARGFTRDVDTLFEHGIHVNIKNHRGDTALHLATFGCYIDVMLKLAEKPEVDVEATNKKGETAFEIAIDRGCFREVQHPLEEKQLIYKLLKGASLQMALAYAYGLRTKTQVRQPVMQGAAPQQEQQPDGVARLGL